MSRVRIFYFEVTGRPTTANDGQFVEISTYLCRITCYNTTDKKSI